MIDRHSLIDPLGPGLLDAPVPHPSAAAYGSLRRILAVRLDAMGDVLMTTPAIRAIRGRLPDAHIGLLTSPAGAPAAALLPEVDEVVARPAPWHRTSRHACEADVAEGTRDLVAAVAAGGWEAAIIFTVNSQSPLPTALALALAGVPRRAAYCRENPYTLLTEWLPEPEPTLAVRHEVRRQLDLVAALGFAADGEHLSVRVPPEAARRIRALLATLRIGVDGRPWAILSPGASAPSRRWPPERFAAVGRELVRRHGWRILVTGSDEERAAAEGIAAAIGRGARSLAGSLSIAELAALLACAPVLVSGNSGPVHLAAAVGTPVVDVYALTNPQHTPWAVRSAVITNPVPCAGCRRSICPEGHHACLLGIPPARVVAAALELVGFTHPDAPPAARASIAAA